MAIAKSHKVIGGRKGIWAAAIVASLLLVGCAAQKQARDVEFSGFLGDYSLLKHGGEGQALYIFMNENADWPAYKKVVLDPVVFYQRLDNLEKTIPREDIQIMVNNFYQMLYDQLSNDYEMVQVPGNDTIRIQVALTNVEKTSNTMHTISSILPIGWAVSGTKEYVTGKPAFVGEATVEFKFEDAGTGEILAAGVDRQVGGRRIQDSFDSWVDVNKVMNTWAELLRYRLCEKRGGTDCVKPEM